MTAFLYLHILGGSLALLAGYAALFAPKGRWLHRRAGVLFVWGMVAMGAGAVVVSLARGTSTWLGGPMVIYLVITGMLTVSRSSPPSRSRDLSLMLVGFTAGLLSAGVGVLGLLGPRGPLGAAPSVMSLVNASVLLLGATGDWRVLRRGPPVGPARLARHLWRMCYAMFAATGSFFLGQAQVIPEPLRDGRLLAVLAFLPLPVLFYWVWRIRRAPPRVTLRVPLAPAARPVIVLPEARRAAD